MSRSLRSIKDEKEREATVRRRLSEGHGGLGYLAALDYKEKKNLKVGKEELKIEEDEDVGEDVS